MSQTMLVTGATGNLGREVVRTLGECGATVKAGTRDVSKIAPGEKLHAVRFDYTDPGTYDEALRTVQGVFLVAPPMDAQAPEKLIPFIQRAKAANVQHVVFTSALGMDHDEQAPLRIVERESTCCI